MLTPSSVIVARRDLSASPMGDEAVVLDLKTSAYFGLDTVAAAIWRQIQEPSTVADVRDAVVAAFDVAPDRAEADVLAFLGDLQAEGLVEVRDEPAG